MYGHVRPRKLRAKEVSFVKRSMIVFVLVGMMSFVLVSSASAQTATDPETQLGKDAATLDEVGTNADSAPAIVQAIETMFDVTASQVAALRNDNLGYGEIVILLSLAETLPGGITSQNIDQILQLRQGPPVTGWGKIAETMRLKLGDVVSTVEKATQKSAQAIAKAQAASNNGNGNGRSGGASSGAGGGQSSGSGNAGSNAGGKRP